MNYFTEMTRKQYKSRSWCQMEYRCLCSRKFLVTSITNDRSNAPWSTWLSSEAIRRNHSMSPKSSLRYPQAYTYVSLTHTAKIEAIFVTLHERHKTAHIKGPPTARNIITAANMCCMLHHEDPPTGQFWRIGARGVALRTARMQDTQFRMKWCGGYERDFVAAHPLRTILLRCGSVGSLFHHDGGAGKIVAWLKQRKRAVRALRVTESLAVTTGYGGFEISWH